MKKTDREETRLEGGREKERDRFSGRERQGEERKKRRRY